MPPKSFIPDLDRIAPHDPPVGVAADEFWFTKGYHAIDELEAAALDAGSKPPAMIWDSLSPEAKKALDGWMAQVQGQMSDARYASVRFAEFRGDTALLNYNRRLNYNTWLGTLMPYEFWFTRSMANWALHSLDRPAMLTTYLRMKNFIETSGLPDQAVPARLRGSIRIELPFLPDWMGDSVFVDPFRFAFPFEQLKYGFEQNLQRQLSLDGRTERLIQEMVSKGQLQPEEADMAIEQKSGPVWEQAKATAIDNDANLKFDAFDFASLNECPTCAPDVGKADTGRYTRGYPALHPNAAYGAQCIHVAWC